MPDPPNQGLTREHYLEFTRNVPFFKLMGLEVVDMKPGWSLVRIKFREDLCQPMGILHGGVMATIIDTGIAHAIMLTDLQKEHLADGGGIVSVDLRVKYLRPVSGGIITCESTIPRLGRQIVHGESIVKNEEGKEVARGDSIYMAVAGKRLRKRGR